MCLNEVMFSPGGCQDVEGIRSVDDLAYSSVASDKQPKPVPPFDCSTYSMMFFKVLPCQKKYNHDWTACPGSHPNEKARRRCLLLYRYGAKVCPDMQTRGTCPRGESCYMTHGMFEYYMHPLKYKTKMCKSGSNCRRHYCFFSHAPEELRESTSIPEEWQLQLLPDGSISSSSAAAVLACLPAEAHIAAQAAIAQLPQVVQGFEAGSTAQLQPPQHHLPGMVSSFTGLQPGSVPWGMSPADAGVAGVGEPADGFSYGPACGVSSEIQGHLMSGMVPMQYAQHQQHQTVVQYAANNGLPTNNQGLNGLVLATQHGPAMFPPTGSINSNQRALDGTLPAPQQQSVVATPPASGLAAVSAAAGTGSPAALLRHSSLPPGVLQPISAGGVTAWGPAAPQPPQLQYGFAPSSPQVLPGPVYQSQGPLQPADAVTFQQQAFVHPQAHVPAHPQQQQAPHGSTQVQAQQAMASVPLSQAVLLNMQQLQHPQQLVAMASMPQSAVVPVGSLAQPVAAAGGTNLVQQLQALNLSSMSMPQLLP